MPRPVKTYALSGGEIPRLLAASQTGSLSTLNADGYPYTVPVHFVFVEHKIYIHGRLEGQKMENIRKRNHVCFEVHEMRELLFKGTPCGTATSYESVVVMGNASVLDGVEKKKIILSAFVEKYTPQFQGTEIPEERIRNTGIVEITPFRITEKYYP